MERWAGRVALVTGAYCGIGAAISEALVKHGLTVIGCARNKDRLQEFSDSLAGSEGGSFHPIPCDVSKEEEVLAMFAKIRADHGTLHVCVNNAGLGHEATLLKGKTEHFRSMLEVNVLGLTIVTREAVKLMQSQKIEEGHICNLCSLTGHEVSQRASSHFYSATKFAVNALTEGLRQELKEAKLNIRVTQLSPSLTATEFFLRKSGPKASEKVLSVGHPLEAQDLAESFIYALGAPNHVQVNVLAVTIVTREAVKLMQSRKIEEGHICNLGSLIGHEVATRASSHFYSATKFAVRALTEGLRQELKDAGLNIRVTEVSPSVTATELFARKSGPEVSKKILSVGKPLDAQDVADAFIYALGAPNHMQVQEMIVRPMVCF